MRAWLEISLDNLGYNIDYIKSIYKKEIFAVVKANAYGMGAITITDFLYKKGLRNFAVANVEEGIEIRKLFTDIKILVLGTLLKEEFEIAINNDLTVCISSIDELIYIKENNLKLKIHIKINTGMNRLGFSYSELEKALLYAKENDIKIEGIFSHLSDADTETKEAIIFTRQQLEKFRDILFFAKKTLNYDFKYVHILNSAGIFIYDKIDIDNYIRPGLCMYGYVGRKKIEKLKPVFTLKSKIILIKQVFDKSFISYGRRESLEKNEYYGVLSIGYADGVQKLNEKTYVICNGEKLDVLGTVCMDMLMVKLPFDKISNFKIGDEVIIYNESIIENIKSDNFSIWTLMTGIGNRVKRIYLGGEYDKNCNKK